MQPLISLLHDETGAVTVDWVVLTAAAAVLGLSVVMTLTTGTSDIAGEIETTLAAVSVQSLSTPP